MKGQGITPKNINTTRRYTHCKVCDTELFLTALEASENKPRVDAIFAPARCAFLIGHLDSPASMAAIKFCVTHF